MVINSPWASRRFHPARLLRLLPSASASSRRRWDSASDGTHASILVSFFCHDHAGRSRCGHSRRALAPPWPCRLQPKEKGSRCALCIAPCWFRRRSPSRRGRSRRKTSRRSTRPRLSGGGRCSRLCEAIEAAQSAAGSRWTGTSPKGAPIPLDFLRPRPSLSTTSSLHCTDRPREGCAPRSRRMAPGCVCGWRLGSVRVCDPIAARLVVVAWPVCRGAADVMV